MARPAGTQLVQDIGLGTSAEVDELTVVAGELFFAASSAPSNRELWKSDGTALGTVQVADLDPAGSAAPGNLTEVGGRLFFTANDGVHGRELWITDGTALGTAMIEVAAGSAGITVDETTSLNGEWIASLDDGISGQELWKSDGTPGGTSLLSDTVPGLGGSDPRRLTSLGGLVWYSAEGVQTGRELFTSDGTVAGTGLVADLATHPATGSSLPTLQAQIGGKLLFTADDGLHGVELWVSDGTEAGTTLLADLNPGAEGSNPIHFARFQDRVVFVADGDPGPSPNHDLYVTDGTAAGTSLLLDQDFSNSTPDDFFATPDRLYFTAWAFPYGKTPWTWDGESTPRRLTDHLQGGLYVPPYFTPIGDKVLFSSDDKGTGQELYITDGTTEGTILLRDLTPGSSGTDPQHLTRYGDIVLFSGRDDEHGQELWRTDGTPAGTYLVKDLDNSAASSNPQDFVVSGDRVFFIADSSPGALHGVFVTDGTAEGTFELPGMLPQFGLVPFRDGVLAWGIQKIGYSDGTSEGTALVYTDLYDVQMFGEQAVAGDLAYFSPVSIAGASAETELWSTDGTLAGTGLVANTSTSPHPWTESMIRNIAAVGDGREIFFSGYESTHGGELWLSDGTSMGTQLLADLYPGVGSSFPASPMRVGNTLFFVADNGESGFELFSMPFTATGGYAYEPFGSSCTSATTGQAPRIAASGAATLGSTLSIEVEDAPPTSPALLYISLATGSVPLGDCTFYLGAPFFYVDFAVTDGAGAGAISAALPAGPALLGVPIYLQYLVADPGGPVAGVATLSDALELMLGS